jgi:hypothetical protein
MNFYVKKGLNFNEDKWQTWLMSFFVSMLVNLLISQPLQVELFILILQNRQLYQKYDLDEPNFVFKENINTVCKHFQ